MALDFDTPEQLLRLLTDLAPTLRERFGVRSLGVFGSWARGDARPDSDVDLLVEFEVTTFRRYMGLRFHLEDLLGRRVDLVTRPALRPRLREQILSEVRFAA
jgi:hypothetical protein